jgi:hypothetical protein
MAVAFIYCQENRKQVKAREIVFIALLFFFGFMMVEFLIAHMVFEFAFQRFLARIILLALFYLIVYIMFNVRDLQRKFLFFESSHSRDHQMRSRERLLRLKQRAKKYGKGGYGRYKGKSGGQ